MCIATLDSPQLRPNKTMTNTNTATNETTNPENQTLPTFEPRGERRLIYTSDPSNLAFYQVGRQVNHMPDAETARSDPARREDLVEWVDALAHHGMDAYAQAIYAQGWTVFFRSDRFEYDARPQHQRFVSMMDAGVTPLAGTDRTDAQAEHGVHREVSHERPTRQRGTGCAVHTGQSVLAARGIPRRSGL